MKLNTEPIFDISLQVCQPVHQHIYVWSWCFVHGHSQAVARSFARSFPASDVTFVPARRACSIVLTGLNRTALHLVALFIARSLTVVFPLLTSSSLILTAYCDLVSLFARRACPIVWTGFMTSPTLVNATHTTKLVTVCARRAFARRVEGP